ncbi:MAG: hypothetical protein IJ727_09125 [Treponema sp.]|nr:hypothetical protein [Treponema sp.]
MKIISVAAVTAGGKTSAVKSLVQKLPKSTSLHFDDYSFEGEVEDFYQWVNNGAHYNVWNLAPLKNDIEKIKAVCHVKEAVVAGNFHVVNVVAPSAALCVL